jgi:hypothetical protein
MRIQDAIDMAKGTCKDLVIGQSRARWMNGALYWVCHNGDLGEPVKCNDTVLYNSWDLVPEPPKRYDFVEALAMMRQGKWMRPVGTAYWFSRNLAGVWVERGVAAETHEAMSITLSNTDQMWEERQ